MKTLTYRKSCLAAAAFFIIAGLGSCKKFLDAKSDQRLVIPTTLDDCQALLDDNLTMNANYTSNEQYADNYYLNFANWNTQNKDRRDGYTWNADANTEVTYWSTPYQKVLNANQVLDILKKIEPSTNPTRWNELKGAALFYRAFTFYNVAELWAQPYKTSTAATDLGIPTRLTADISAPTSRASVQGTYDQIIQDLKEASTLLPATLPTTTIYKLRPAKTAAYAMLARVYLAMGDYANAGTNASAALQLYNTLIDYNTLTPTAPFPVAQFNAEVLFDAQAIHPMLAGSVAKVDSTLQRSYVTDDLRRTVFFNANVGTNAGTFSFKGSYQGFNSVGQFIGLAVDEMYLIRAESYARAGNTASAMADLNTLLRKRWVTNTYTDMTAADANDALVKILTERRKELLFRGLRWTDLKRLNQTPATAVTLTRILNGQSYSLPPNDVRYTLLLPLDVIKREPMPQPPR